MPAIGVKFNGAKGAIPVLQNGRFNSALLKYYLKKQAPELKDMIEQRYDKGKDKKASRKELTENPSVILELYDEYLKTHDALNDPVTDKDSEEDKASDSNAKQNG